MSYRIEVRKAASAHYFSVFDATDHVVSGEVKAGAVEFYPVARRTEEVSSLPDEACALLRPVVLERCAAVDAEMAAWEATKERKRKARTKTDPAPAEEPKPRAATKKGGR